MMLRLRLNASSSVPRNPDRFRNTIEWFRLPTCPTDIKQIMKMDACNFLMLSASNMIFIYNKVKSLWILPNILQNLSSNIKSMAMNYMKNEMYILIVRKNKGKILRFRYYRQHCGFAKLHSVKLNSYFQKTEKVLSIFADGKYHLIRHQHNNNNHAIKQKRRNDSFHHIYDPQTNRVKVYQLDNDYNGVSLIYFEKKHELMLFRRSECVKSYSLRNRKWSTNITKETKIKINVITPYSEQFGFFLRENIKYLSIFGYEYSVLFDDEYWNEHGTIHDVNNVQIIYTQPHNDDGNDVYDVVPVSMKCLKSSEYILSLEKESIHDPFLLGFFRICFLEHDNNKRDVPELPLTIMTTVYRMAGKIMFAHLFNLYHQ